MNYKRYTQYSACIFFALGAWGILGNFKIPASFGKTHFIVGYPFSCTQKQETRDNSPDALPRLHASRILFAPDDDIQSYLLDLIAHETTSIQMAIFMLTTKEVIHALLMAYKRGVTVDIIIDALCMQQARSKISQLIKAGISVYEYKPGQTSARMNNLMHNKFIIFGSTRCNKSLVWTGSFNVTRSAQLNNQENVVILEDVQAVEKFTSQFARLRQRSKRLR